MFKIIFNTKNDKISKICKGKKYLRKYNKKKI